MHVPVILPGDPVNRLPIIKQLQGNHPGQLSLDELARLKEWIKWGAPKQ